MRNEKSTEQIDSLKKHHLKSQTQLGIILQPKNVKRAAEASSEASSFSQTKVLINNLG